MDVSQGSCNAFAWASAWRSRCGGLHVFNSVYGSASLQAVHERAGEAEPVLLRKAPLPNPQGAAAGPPALSFDKFEAARRDLCPAEAMKQGEISDEEFTAAKRCVASDLRSLTTVRSWRLLPGPGAGRAGLWPHGSAETVEDVTKRIYRIAQSVECDMILPEGLRGGGGHESVIPQYRWKNYTARCWKRAGSTWCPRPGFSTCYAVFATNTAAPTGSL